MRLQLLCMMLFSIPVFSMAGVNPKNGNFYMTDQDLTLETGGHTLMVTL